MDSSFRNIVEALGIIGAIIILLINDSGLAFQPNPNLIIPPHLQLLDGNHFVLDMARKTGPRTSTVAGLTQNAGSEKNYLSYGSYNYIDVMRELDKQSNKKIITIQVADQIYDSIKKCDTDIWYIAANIGFKADNIKNIKDHIFYKEHELDQYVSLGE